MVVSQQGNQVSPNIHRFSEVTMVNKKKKKKIHYKKSIKGTGKM